MTITWDQFTDILNHPPKVEEFHTLSLADGLLEPVWTKNLFRMSHATFREIQQIFSDKLKTYHLSNQKLVIDELNDKTKAALTASHQTHQSICETIHQLNVYCGNEQKHFNTTVWNQGLRGKVEWVIWKLFYNQTDKLKAFLKASLPQNGAITLFKEKHMNQLMVVGRFRPINQEEALKLWAEGSPKHTQLKSAIGIFEEIFNKDPFSA